MADPPIEDVIAELAAQVPDEEWDGVPRDLTSNLDHYLYGTPKDETVETQDGT